MPQTRLPIPEPRPVGARRIRRAERADGVSDEEAEQLLRGLLSSRPDEARVVSLAASDGAFERAFQLAGQRQLAPALHEAVDREWRSVAPVPVRAVLAAIAVRNAARNRACRDLTLELGRSAARLGIELVLLKGIAWVVEDADRAAPWRWLTDVDLLVPPQLRDTGMAAMEAAGWRRPYEPNFVTRYHDYDTRFVRTDALTGVDLHHHLLLEPRLLPSELVFEHSRPIAPGLRMPAPWCRALHAILHWQHKDQGRQRLLKQVLYAEGEAPKVVARASGHSDMLRQSFEMSRFMRRPDVDWERLRQHADRVGLGEHVDRSLALASLLLDAPIPAAAPVPRQAVLRAAADLRRPRFGEFDDPDRLAAEAKRIWACESVRYAAEWGEPPWWITTKIAGLRLFHLPRVTALLARAALLRIGSRARSAS